LSELSILLLSNFLFMLRLNPIPSVIQAVGNLICNNTFCNYDSYTANCGKNKINGKQATCVLYILTVGGASRLNNQTETS
jgi:hypothetical protein